METFSSYFNVFVIKMAFDKNAVFSVGLFFVVTSIWDFSTSCQNWLCIFFISFMQYSLPQL